jgi:hypothetical protein
MGWCLDTRELFIGNSDAYGANTQVLTQWTPNDALIQHAYHGATGVPADTRPRSIGDKLDDLVSVRDYGAKGNGVDDDHAAIQQAIRDRYAKVVANGFSPLSGYVTIWLPAGTYRITKPLDLYPSVRLQGEGANRTKIFIDDALADCVVRTADSAGNTALNIGMDSAELPNGIDLIDLWLDQPNASSDVVHLQRASMVTLQGVRISGPRVNLSEVQIETIGIKVQSLGTMPTSMPKNIVIDDCEIYGMGHAVYSDDPIKGLKINLSNIHDCWYGVTLGANAVLGGPAMTKITNTVFADIEATGIACYSSNLGVISMGNSFDQVGVHYATNAIYWSDGANGCASIGDQFGASAIKSISDNNPAKNTIVGPQQASISTYTPNLIGPVTLLDNNPVLAVNTTISYDVTKFNTINIDYSLNRDTSKRSGKLTILTNGTAAVVQDEFTTLGSDLGVTFGYRITANMVTLTYTTTGTGHDAVMSYTETKWLG